VVALESDGSFFDVPSVSVGQRVPQQKYQTMLLNLMQQSSGTYLGVFLMHNHRFKTTIVFSQFFWVNSMSVLIPCHFKYREINVQCMIIFCISFI
jgi:hypothetical protein